MTPDAIGELVLIETSRLQRQALSFNYGETDMTADTQEALDAKGLESSTTAFSQEQLAKLAFAIFYSANLCAPQNIEAVVKEIDTCGNDCEHVRGSHCQREERGDYCPFSLAEDLRQISAALFGPRDPSHYVPSVFGPECMTAFRATTRAPGEGEPVVYQYRYRRTTVEGAAWGSWGEYKGGALNASNGWAQEQRPLYTAPPALAAPSYAQAAPRADLVEALKVAGCTSDDGTMTIAPTRKVVEAIAALSEAPREAEGWREITEDQSPPHDTPVLLWSPPCFSHDGQFEARPFSTGRSGPGWSEYSQHSHATHWMPLPTAPKREG